MNKYIYEQKWKITYSILLSFVNNVCLLCIVNCIQRIIDALQSGSKAVLLYSLLQIGIALLLAVILGYFQIKTEASINRNFHIKIKQDLFNALINTRTPNNYSIGEKLGVFENDCDYLEEYYFDNIIDLVRNTILLLISIAYLLSINSLWGLVLIILVSVSLILPPLFGKRIDSIGEECSVLKSSYMQSLQNYFEGGNLIRAFSIEDKISEGFSIVLGKLEDKINKLNVSLGFYGQVLLVGNYMVIVLSLLAGGLMVINGEISIGELIAATQLLNIIIQPLGDIGTSITEIIGSKTIKNKLEGIIEEHAADGAKENVDDEIDTELRSIMLKNINYGVNGKDIITGLNMNITNGKYVIIGPSGSGKTTILKLIANIINADSGEITINGDNYYDKTDYISRNIIYVSQDTFLFSDSIENNIKLYREYDAEKYAEALSISKIEKKAKEQREDILTDDNISGGERQRLGIARAVLLDPQLMLLDEITASIDDVTSENIIESLLSLDSSMIFVTHKMHRRLMKRADRIFCIENGTIVEEGSFNKLIKNKGYFYRRYMEGNELC